MATTVPISQELYNISLNCLDIPKDAKAAPPISATNMNKVNTACEELIIFSPPLLPSSNCYSDEILDEPAFYCL